MTLAQAIQKLLGQAAGEVANLKAILAALITRFPDLAAELNPILQALDATLTPEALSALGAGVLAEALNVAVGKIAGTDHPGDEV